MPDGFEAQGPAQPTVVQDTPIDVATTGSPVTGALTGPAQNQVLPPVVGGQAQPTAPAVSLHVGKLAGVGHLFSTLTGRQNVYSIDPKTGQTVATPVPEKPGQMFRNMLAGALVGGAAGGQDFLTGFARGGAASISDQRRMEEERRAQAQEQFRNQLMANREAREQKSFASSEQLKAAELAHANLMTVREQQLLEKEGFEFNKENADMGSAIINHYRQAGIPPEFENKTWDELQDINKNRPDAGSRLLWQVTGIKTDIGPNGKPIYTKTYSAINRDASVEVNQGFIDTLKKSGFEQYQPETFKHLKIGTKISGDTAAALYDQAQRYRVQKLEEDTKTAQLEEARARLTFTKTETEKMRKEIADMDIAKTKQKAVDQALQRLNGAATWDDLDSSDKLLLSDFMKSQAETAKDIFKEAQKDGDTAKANEAFATWKAWDDRYTKALKIAGGTNPPPPPPPPGSIEAFAANTLEVKKKRQEEVAAKEQEEEDKNLISTYTIPNLTPARGRFPAQPNRQYDPDIKAELDKHPNWTTKEKATYIRKVTGQQSQSGMVKVQLPGKPEGFIPEDQLAKFKQDHPDAIVNR